MSLQRRQHHLRRRRANVDELVTSEQPDFKAQCREGWLTSSVRFDRAVTIALPSVWQLSASAFSKVWKLRAAQDRLFPPSLKRQAAQPLSPADFQT
jgi:hypothetical protein